jgi:diketogulonate reductase-like aldo/keto reductase
MQELHTYRLHNGVVIPAIGFGTWKAEGGGAYKRAACRCPNP